MQLSPGTVHDPIYNDCDSRQEGLGFKGQSDRQNSYVVSVYNKYHAVRLTSVELAHSHQVYLIKFKSKGIASAL